MSQKIDRAKFEQMLQQIGLTKTEFARQVHYSRDAVYRWRYLPPLVADHLRMMVLLKEYGGRRPIEAVATFHHRLEKLVAERHTGKVVAEVDMNQGGVSGLVLNVQYREK